ncbi:MAG: DNRLRE domain-containing protein [Chloroflexi bacterium]|nr:MAG: DNRLRE domain-containing protein [Chloroflexota bacterium]
MNEFSRLVPLFVQNMLTIGLRPSRFKALSIASAVIFAFAVQPPTPAQAAALWSASTHGAGLGAAHAAPQGGIDPPYQPPAKHGTSYIAPTAPGKPTAKDPVGAEKPTLRTRNSRTFSSGGRQLTTLVYAGSVNYRDASGSWQAIDNSLVKTGVPQYAFQNRANSYTVYLPADIGTAPIRIASGSSWLTFSLLGAKGAGSISGSTAKYSNALPGVTVVIDAQADSLEESLILQDPTAPSQFSYELDLSPGLKLSAVGRGFSIVDGSGRSIFGMTAPVMFDSAKNSAKSSAISMAASKDNKGGSTVTLKADSTWLGNSGRKWPVIIDPTFIVGDLRDCYINAASPTTIFCGGTALNAGFDGTNASRALLQFNLSGVPSTDTVVSAKLLLYLGSASTSNATSLSLYQLTRAWTVAATWNTYDGTNSWTTPGGDFSGTPAATTNGIAAIGVWYGWSPTALVQGWLNGTIANDGLIVKEPTENTTNVLSFNPAAGSNPPYLQVVHQQGGSTPGSYSTTVQSDNPVAYWHLDESSGSTMADAENFDSGTYQGTYTLGQTPLIQPASGTAVSLDGSTGYGTAAALTTLQGDSTRSIELWFQTSSQTAQYLFDAGAAAGSTNQMFSLSVVPANVISGNPPVNTAGLYVALWGQDIYYPGLNVLDGKRHHVVLELSGNTVWLYLDGTTPGGYFTDQGGNDTFRGSWDFRYLEQPVTLTTTPNTGANPVLIGNGRYVATGLLNGKVDEVAVYSTALSATQVQNHWQAGNGLPWSPTNVSGTAGQNQVTVTWTAPTFNGSGITGYVITPQVGSNLRTPITFNSTATSQTITNLSGGASYAFSVSAFNSLGLGVPSSTSSAVTATGSAIPIYEDTVLADSPVGFWPLGEGSFNVATDLTQTFNGQYFNTYTQGDTGPTVNIPNKAANFSGSNAYVRFNHTALLEPAGVTVELWLKPSSVPANDTTVLISPQSGTSENSSNGYVMTFDGTNNGAGGKITWAGITTAAALPSGAWSYVVGTTDGVSTRIYVNGKESSAVTGGGPSYAGAPNFDAQLTRYAFPGDIAGLAIYSSSLTALQVTAHYASAGYAPGPVSNLVATASTNSASLTWTAPSYAGTSPITSYTVTPVVDGKSSTPISVNGNGTGANIPNLPGGGSYTFQVQANNASGAGVIVASSAVTIGSPATGPGGFGTYLYMRGGPGQGQAYAHYGFVSRNNVAAMSSWTLEERLWGWNSLSVTGGHTALGLLSGTPNNPTDQNPIAGLNFNIGGSPLQSYFVWPGGGSCTIPSDPQGLPLGFDSSVTTPTHVAITYDGSTVRGFINGTLVTGCSVATGSAAVPTAPFGFMDNSGLSQAYFDEFRVSNMARYTSNFTPPTQQFTNDSNTQVLWRFNDYPISKLPSTHIVPDQNDGGTFNGGIIPSTYRDSSGNTNHANTVWATSHAINNGSEDWRRPYSLGQGVTADELTGGESKWLCPCTISSTARPVNDATGEFYHTFTDFEVPGRSDLAFTRTYSSQRTATLGPTGYGWTDNYNESITFSLPNGGGDATVHETNGSAVLFTLNGSTYTGPPSEHVTLAKNGSLFDLTDAGHNQEVFNAPDANNISWLHQLIDRHNSAAYTLTLAYTNGNLTTVTDPNGRSLTFTYQTIGTNKLIQTVTQNDSPSRSVSFQYGTNSGDPTTYLSLTQVTDVAGGLTKFTYDASHYLQTMTDPNNGVMTNTYDPSSHQVTRQQEPITTRATTFSYSGGITTITDPKGNVTQEEYLNGILLSRTIGYGTAQAAMWTFSFDPAAVGLTAAVGPNGETVTTVRDANANVLSETDGLGRITSYTYNSFSEPTTIQDPGGDCNAVPATNCTTNTYNATGDLATTSRPLVGTSQVQTITYNHADSSHPGDVTSMVDADSNTWTYAYDSNGYRNSVTDPLGDKTTYVFNSDGWITSSTSPNGYLTRQDTFVRTPVSGSWGTATDANVWTKQAGSATYSTTGTQGKIAKPSSDSWESLGSALANDGGEVLVRWQVATTSDKAGAVLRLSSGAATFYGVRFDGAGHVELFGKWAGTIHTNIGSVRVNYTPGTAKHWFRFRVAGSTLYFKVWADGSQEPANWSGQTTDPNVTGTGFAGLFGNATNTTGIKFDQFAANPYATTAYTYNSFGQRTGLTDPDNHTTNWHYDPNQNLDRITDADGNLTTNVYDADNELTQVKRADLPQTTLVTDYNPDGTVLDKKDGKGNAIQAYQYDGLAHVTTVTDALNNVTTYVDDAYGNLVSKQDPSGSCSAQPATGCTTYAYDVGNQLTAIAYSDGVTPNVSNITYDGNGQRTGMTDGTGTSTWAWDSLHRIVTYTSGNTAQLHWIYNLRNLPTTITYPGSLNVTRGYDNAGRWTTVQDWNTNITSFGYDSDSNLTTETFPSASGVVDAFTFNAADQVTAVASMKGGSTLFSAGYARDAANQLAIDSSAASGTGSYKYTPLNQLCYAGSTNASACASPPTGSIAYKYDAADNLIQKGSTQQVFNSGDELCWTASASGACGSPPSGSTTYQYDARGNRTAVLPSGGQAQSLTYDQADRLTTFVAAATSSYGYDGDGLRMCKYAGTSTQPCHANGNTAYVWDISGLLPLLLKEGTASYIYGPGGLPVEQINTGTTVWYHHDQLGSTRVATDASGTTQATYTYDPYAGLASSTGSITNPFRFGGQYQDSESGFYYLRARYYDPATGQLLTVDPAVSTTRQPYGYIAGNPLNGTDPSGLDWWSSVQHFASKAANIADQVMPVVAQVAKTTALVCGLASLTVVLDEVTVPCAIAASAVALGADSYLALRGKATIGDLVEDTIGLALSAVGGYGAVRAGAAGVRWLAADAKLARRCISEGRFATAGIKSLQRAASDAHDAYEGARIGSSILETTSAGFHGLDYFARYQPQALQ